MKRILSLIACLVVMASGTLLADEMSVGTPASANIGTKALYKHEYLKLHVPKSFEGRTGKEQRNIFSTEVNDLFRFTHTSSDVELRGSVTKFDFSYNKDCIDAQIYRSKSSKPSDSSCLSCHSKDFPKTSITLGYEHEKLEPEPYFVANTKTTIYLWDTVSNSFKGEINHWLNKRLMLKGAVMGGRVEQKNYKLDGQAFSIGLAGSIWHRCMWNGDYIISKLDTYSTRQTLKGSLTYHPANRLKLSVGGVAFLDGYTQYGTDMAELSMMTLQLQKDNEKSLPNLFKRLKDDAFGTWVFSAEYEIAF